MNKKSCKFIREIWHFIYTEHKSFLNQLSKHNDAFSISQDNEPRVCWTISLPLENDLSLGVLVAETANTFFAIFERQRKTCWLDCQYFNNSKFSSACASIKYRLTSAAAGVWEFPFLVQIRYPSRVSRFTNVRSGLTE